MDHNISDLNDGWSCKVDDVQSIVVAVMDCGLWKGCIWLQLIYVCLDSTAPYCISLDAG